MNKSNSLMLNHRLAHRVTKLYGLVTLIFFTLFSTSEASKTYQTPSDFVEEQFSGNTPQPQLQTITSAMQERLKQINGSPYRSSRIRYWQQGTRTVYILDDIGKTLPITIGYVIDDYKISKVKVLIYRESHGDDVCRSYFTKQFKSLSLKSNGKLSKTPKNIAGATLSVRTLSRMARAALFLSAEL